MRALTIQQPWAWLIVHGRKGIENRSWGTRHRGPLAIHAGLTYDRAAEQWIIEHIPTVLWDDMPTRAELTAAGQMGAVVGTCELHSVYQPHEGVSHWPWSGLSPKFAEHQPLWRMFGCHAWQLVNPVAFVAPVPWRGRLGLWEVPILDCVTGPMPVAPRERGAGGER